MDKDFKPVKSVYETNYDVIKNIMTLYDIPQFDLDCTYSKGNFWKNLPEPINNAGSVLPLRAITLAVGIEPALSAKRLSSAILSAKSSRPVSTPTRTARAASTSVLYRASFFYTKINRTSWNDR